MKILVVNAGSSSLKYQLIDMKKESCIAKGLCERIGADDSKLIHKVKGKEDYVVEQAMASHKEAVQLVLDTLVDKKVGVIKKLDEIDAVGHRVVHGGEKYTESVIIDNEVILDCEKLSGLAPLHNPANIIGIKACKDVLPDKPQVAVFDTAFHSTMPSYAYLYAIPYNIYTNLQVRKYGFHGMSHKYVSELANKAVHKKSSKIITCHLGNGASVSAIKDGVCIDTSMGFTPLEGVAMGTRSGDIDPSVVMYVAKRVGRPFEDVMSVLNKKSGILGVSGVSNDFRDVAKAAEEGNERAQLALDIFAYRVKKYIGSYIAALGGVDAIVFTAGVGENDAKMRAKILEGMEGLGIKVNENKNEADSDKDVKSIGAGKVKVFVIPTNEELVIARETAELIK